MEKFSMCAKRGGDGQAEPKATRRHIKTAHNSIRVKNPPKSLMKAREREENRKKAKVRRWKEARRRQKESKVSSFLLFPFLAERRSFFLISKEKYPVAFVPATCLKNDWARVVAARRWLIHVFHKWSCGIPPKKSCSQLSWVLAMDLRDVFIYAMRSWSRTCRLSFIKSTHDEEEKKPTLWMKVGIAAQKRDVVGGFLIFVFISHSLARSRTHITLAVTHVLPPITLIPFFSTHLISPSLPSPISRFCCSFFSLHHMLVDSFQSLINSAMRFNTKKYNLVYMEVRRGDFVLWVVRELMGDDENSHQTARVC